MTDTNDAKSCTMSSCFNYCFWAKSIVAIPAIPLISIYVASFYSDPAWQFTMASYSGALVVLIAQYIDRVPFLTRKFRQKK